MQDYLLTNTLYLRPAGLAEVEASFGSLPHYLQEVLGVDAAALQKLQARYLQG